MMNYLDDQGVMIIYIHRFLFIQHVWSSMMTFSWSIDHLTQIFEVSRDLIRALGVKQTIFACRAPPVNGGNRAVGGIKRGFIKIYVSRGMRQTCAADYMYHAELILESSRSRAHMINMIAASHTLTNTLIYTNGYWELGHLTAASYVLHTTTGNTRAIWWSRSDRGRQSNVQGQVTSN